MDRITEIRIRNFRTLADVRLRLDGLTVLIGENASGKSTILEAFEILHRTARTGFLDSLYDVHGGAASLFRAGTNELTLGVLVEGDNGSVHYEISLVRQGHSISLRSEVVEKSDSSNNSKSLVLRRRAQNVQYDGNVHGSVADKDSALSQRIAQPEARRIAECLGSIGVHVAFDVVPAWVGNSVGRGSPLRVATLLKPADRVDLLGRNLASVYFKLKNDFDEASWAETMDFVRLGLGDDVASVNTRVDPAGGNVALELKFRRGEPLAASQLSDGTLSWLAFVAIHRMSRPGEFLAFDEPELHLHPGLLFRVVEMFESLAKARPVLLATHSDRLLDFLHTPDKSVVVCELDSNRVTHLRRPDPDALREWMQRYSGYGAIRGAGYEASLLRDPEP
jgi:predicted ATPase